MPLKRLIAKSSEENSLAEHTDTLLGERSNLGDHGREPVRERRIATLNQALSDLSLDSPLANTSPIKGKGKERLDERQGVSASEQLRKLSGSEESRRGTYAGKNDEKTRLESIGFSAKARLVGEKYQWTTERAHLVDHVVAYPPPYVLVPLPGINEKEKQKAYDLGAAYTEDRYLHQAHVGSHINEWHKGFDATQHAWGRPDDYRWHAELALRDNEAKDGETGFPTNLSNTIQLNILDFAHVQKHHMKDGHEFGLYQNKSKMDAADNSFKYTIKANPPVFFIDGKKIGIAAGTVSRPAQSFSSAKINISIQDARIVGRRLTSYEQAELVLARESLNRLRYPDQKSINSVAKEFLSKDEFDEKNALWKEADDRDDRMEALTLRQEAVRHEAQNSSAQRAFAIEIIEAERNLAEQAEEERYSKLVHEQTQDEVRSTLEPIREMSKRYASDIAYKIEKSSGSDKDAASLILDKSFNTLLKNEKAQQVFADRIKRLESGCPSSASDEVATQTNSQEQALRRALKIENNASSDGEAILKLQQAAARWASGMNRAHWTFRNYANELEGRIATREEEEKYPLPAGLKRNDDLRQRIKKELEPSRQLGAHEALKEIYEIKAKALDHRGAVGWVAIQEMEQAATQRNETNNMAQRGFEDRISTLEKGISERNGQTSKKLSSNVAIESAQISSSPRPMLDERHRVRRFARG